MPTPIIPSTIRLRALRAVLDLLNTDLPPDIPAASRRRWSQSDTRPLPLISVWMIEEAARRSQPKSGGARERVLYLAVQCIASGEDLDDVEDRVEPLLDWCVSRLGDTTLDGLVHELQEEATQWEVIDAEQLYVVASIRWALTYQTLRTDLSLAQ